MCGRYSLAVDPAQLRARFSLGPEMPLARRYNVCPGDAVPAVTTDDRGARRGEHLRWGLVPHWSKTAQPGATMINARAETLAERPAYREPFERSRCLVIADGYYEWQPREGLPKLAWHITRADRQPFAFAGLWTSWRSPEGKREELRSCTIVTTDAARATADIHARMPVMLDAAAEAEWLDGSTPAERLRELLRAPSDDLIAWRPVGRAVNDANYDGPDCLDAADPADLAPATLF